MKAKPNWKKNYKNWKINQSWKLKPNLKSVSRMLSIIQSTLESKKNSKSIKMELLQAISEVPWEAKSLPVEID